MITTIYIMDDNYNILWINIFDQKKYNNGYYI